VTKKAAGGPARDPTGPSPPPGIECLINVTKSLYLEVMEREKTYTRMYVYSYERLASTLREYKTIRMSEFYGFSQSLLQPQPEIPTTVERATPASEDGMISFGKMQEFCDTFSHKFN
jgi:hypothetical protein